MPPGTQLAALPIGFSSTPGNTLLSLGSSDNQELEPEFGIRFGGGAYQPASSLPFPGAHVGADGNRLTVAFSLETIAIGVNV